MIGVVTDNPGGGRDAQIPLWELGLVARIRLDAHDETQIRDLATA